MPKLKQILTAAVLLLLPAFSYAGPSVSHDEPTSQEIKIVKGKDKGKIKIPREMFPDVKAYYNGDTVYVDLFETGLNLTIMHIWERIKRIINGI